MMGMHGPPGLPGRSIPGQYLQLMSKATSYVVIFSMTEYTHMFIKYNQSRVCCVFYVINAKRTKVSRFCILQFSRHDQI